IRADDFAWRFDHGIFISVCRTDFRCDWREMAAHYRIIDHGGDNSVFHKFDGRDVVHLFDRRVCNPNDWNSDGVDAFDNGRDQCFADTPHSAWNGDDEYDAASCSFHRHGRVRDDYVDYGARSI